MRPFYVVKRGNEVIYAPNAPVSKAMLKRVRDEYNAELNLPESGPERTRAFNRAVKAGHAAYIGVLS